MKKYIIYLLIMAVVSIAIASCSKDKLSEDSVISVSSTEKNAFDYWLDLNFLKPYNIDFHYRYDFKESDKGYVTIPADYDASIIYAHLVKYLCIDTYDEVAGVDFTKAYFPKMFFLIGEWEYNNNYTYILGTAEGGKKIMLSGVNTLPAVFEDYSGDAFIEELNNSYIKTIHHEFTHIINQTKAYPDSFKDITPVTYEKDAWSETDDNFLSRGYITKYAQNEPREDFAELLSEYITHDSAWWNSQLTKAGIQGAAFITAKMDLVREYMTNSWGIDIDELRDVIGRRTKDVAAGKIDLTDISVK
ncbi:MAG: putative zinc-binding metallopeptidase [Bacteroidota bacterium]|nr:putative zinc-binding metallopeptidase [Bacteroidota bacterium]